MMADAGRRWRLVRSFCFAAAALAFVFYVFILGDIPGREEIRIASEGAAAGETGTAPAGETGKVPAVGLHLTFTGTGRVLSRIGLAFTDVPEGDEAVQLRIRRGNKLLWGRRYTFERLREEPRQEPFVNIPTKEGAVYEIEIETVKPGAAPDFYRPSTRGRAALEGYDTAAAAVEPAPFLETDGPEERLPALERIELLPASFGARARYAVGALPFFACLALLLHFFLRPGRWRVFLFALYTGFALCGSRTLLYPVGAPFAPAGLLQYALVCLLCAPLPVLLFRGVKRLAPLCISGKRRLPSPLFAAVVLALQLIPLAYTLWALNPLNSSVDTLTVVQNAMSLGKESFSDWTPFLYVLYVRLALAVWDHISAIALFNWIFWCFVILKFFLWLRERGLADLYLIAGAALVGFNTANVLLVNTGWKDIPYTCSVLWLFLCVLKLAVDPERYARRRSFLAELILSLFGTAGFRRNGVMTAALVCLVLLLFFKAHRRRFAAVSGIVAALILALGPLGRLAGAVPTLEKTRMYTAFSSDLETIWVEGGELPEEALRFITFSQMENDNLRTYDPSYYSILITNWYPHTFAEIASFVPESVLRNPGRYLLGVMRRNDLLWGIPPGEISTVATAGFIWTHQYDEPVWTARAPERRVNEGTAVMTSVTKLTLKNPLLNILLWRGGIWLWAGLLVLLMAAWTGRRRAAWLAAAVPLSNVAGLVIANGFGGEFRFTWPQNLIGFFSLLMIPLLFRRGNTPEETP